MDKKNFAPGEARTHGLQIMRLTRCLLRYGGSVLWQGIKTIIKKKKKKKIGRIKRSQKMRQPGIEPGSTAWKAAMLTTIPLTIPPKTDPCGHF